MTVSLVVIMFELTGGLTYIVPFMTAVMVSKWVGDALMKEGIYDAHIRLNGYPFLDNKEEVIAPTVACDIMQPPRDSAVRVTALQLRGNTIQSLETLLEDNDFSGYPVVTSAEEMHVVGYVGRRELETALDRIQRLNRGISAQTPCFFHDRSTEAAPEAGLDLYECVHTSPFQLPHEMPLPTVVEVFRRMGIRYALVTKFGRLNGIVTKKDLLKHLAVLNHQDPNTITFH